MTDCRRHSFAKFWLKQKIDEPAAIGSKLNKAEEFS